MPFRKAYNHFCMYAEEIILGIIILLNVLDAIKVLPPSLEYTKKIISWGALGYLLYHASLTKLLFGIKSKKIDFFIIMSYFLLIFNKFTSYARVTLEELYTEGYELLHFSQAKVGEGAIKVSVENVDAITTADFTYSVLYQIIEKLSFFNPTTLLEVTDGTNTIYLAASTQPFSLQHFFSYINGSLFYLIKYLADNAAQVEMFAFLIGGVALIIIALYWAVFKKVESPSFMHVIHEEGKVKDVFHRILRFLIILVVLVGFFVIVFNLIMEWLAVAIDAFIIVVLIFAYVYWVFKGHKHFNADHFLIKVGSGSEKFFEKFVELFHTKQGVFLGISGLLVLHLITDMGIFILPYILFPQDPLYFHQDPIYFSTGHEALSTLFAEDLNFTSTLMEKFSLLWAYVFSSLGIILLFTIPAYVWALIFKKRKGHTHRLLLVLFFMSLLCFAFTDLFKIKRLETLIVVGVDIVTSPIMQTLSLSLLAIFLISIGVGAIFYLLSHKMFLRKELTYGMVIISLIYFGKYVYYFFFDNVEYYLDGIHALVQINSYFFALFFLMFFAISIVFYVGGFCMFIYEIYKYFRMSKEG